MLRKIFGRCIIFPVLFAIAASIISTLMLVKAQGEYTNMQTGASMPLPPGVVPDVEIDTRAFLSFRPNPVGVGQPVLVNVWIQPPIHVSRWFEQAFKITITDPDGRQQVIVKNSYRGDASAWLEFIPDKVGKWKIKFDFLGGYFPAGNYTVPPGTAVWLPRVVEFKQSCYYKPSSSPELELTVQQEAVKSWPPSPLPAEYWTRPVPFEHREWWPILGNYPWRGPGGGDLWNKLYPNTNPYWGDKYSFIPWVQGPESSHIVWRRQGAMSGIVGGDIPQFEMSTVSGAPTIIYNGKCYQALTKVINGMTKTVWQCYDLRTGEIIWEKMDVTRIPTVIEYDPGIGEIPEAAGRAFAELGYVNLLYIGGGLVIKYSPWTGEVTGNYSIAPLTTGLYYRNLYALSVQDLGPQAGAERYRLINWTTAGQPAVMGAKSRAPSIISNTTYARGSIPPLCDWNVCLGASVESIINPAAGVDTGTVVRGYDLKTGKELWNVTLVNESMYVGASCAIADHGKVAVLFKGGYFKAWDLKTGKLVWKSEVMDYPWGEASFGAYTLQSAYGLLYRQSYDGVYAFDWETGKIVWKYVAPAKYPFETPYTDKACGQTVYSFMTGALIADGKMYVINSEHTPTSPVTRGWGIHCINVTTGEKIWSIGGIWSWSASGFPGAIADGYLIVSSSDGYMYVFGKGPTRTTVEAPNNGVPVGSTIVVRGTVVDVSPGTKDPNIQARFPNGVPAVSDENMSEWTEYVYLQQPRPTNVKGVWVKLDAVNVYTGEVLDIGGTRQKKAYGG